MEEGFADANRQEEMEQEDLPDFQNVDADSDHEFELVSFDDLVSPTPPDEKSGDGSPACEQDDGDGDRGIAATDAVTQGHDVPTKSTPEEEGGAWGGTDDAPLTEAPPIPAPDMQVTWEDLSETLRRAYSSIRVVDESYICEGLDRNSQEDYDSCLGSLRKNLWEERCWKVVAQLQAFRVFFSQSDKLQMVFQGEPLEVLENVFYGGTGILPKDSKKLPGGIHKGTRTDVGEPLEVLENVFYGGTGILPKDSQKLPGGIHKGTRTDENFSWLTHTGKRTYSASQSAREVYQDPEPSDDIDIPPSTLLPKRLPDIRSAPESALRHAFIMNMTQYEGTPLAPNEAFELTWVTLKNDMEEYLTSGLIPMDNIKSSGLDNTSYQHMVLCAEKLQSNLFDHKLLECLGNLRGFRQLFSMSTDPVLKHAFRGPPLEVLQNIYFGGTGVLPEERMLLGDPFHHSHTEESLYVEDSD